MVAYNRAIIRWDQTAGRAAYIFDTINQREQLVFGDTGKRNIGGQMAGVGVIGSGTENYIRRVGSLVSFQIDVVLDASYVAGTSIYTIPAGFGASDSPTYIGPGYAGTVWYISSGVKYGTSGANPGTRGMWQWFTTEPWPTVLPGTAVGAIPFA